MSLNLRIRLSVMMFIQYGIWGTWFVTMGTYLFNIGFQGTDIGSAYSTTALAAIISPFFVGMIADRFFSAEKVLGLMHITGAVFLYLASQIKTPETFFWVLLLYNICYMPTLALTNAISFHQMQDPEKEFPSIRVWGTPGWIAAGWLIALLEIEDTSITMMIAAGTSIALGLYCFFLPHTPPKSAGKKVTLSDVLGLDALKLMKDTSFTIFVISSLLICIPLAFYYNFANPFFNEVGMEKAAGKMTFGQMSEIVFMFLMPFFFTRLGVKKMLLTGMIAWMLRYVLFALGNNENLVFMFYLGILLHGICYDFFFVAGQIYVDKKAPVDIRASAQGFISLVTLGLGIFIGAKIAGWVVDHYQIMDTVQKISAHNWQQIWLIPAAMSGVVAFVFTILFKEKLKSENKTATNKH